MIAFFAAQVVAGLGGWVLLIALGARVPPGLFLPAAWLAGTGALAVERLVLAQIGVPWAPWVLALPWVVPAVVLVRRGWSWRWLRRRVLDIAVLGVIGAWTGAMFWQATNQPPAGWDAWAMWFLKGRALYQAGGLPEGFFTDPFFAAYAHLDYPLLVPLVIAGTYAWTGDLDTLLKGWWPLLAGAAACGLYFGLAGVVGWTARVGGLGLLLGLPEVWRHTVGDYAGYADLPLAVFVLFGGVFLCRREFLAAALFFGLAGFTKNEGLVVALAGTGMAVAMGRSFWAGVIAAVVVLPWQWQRVGYGLEAELARGVLQWDRLGVVWEGVSAVALDVSRFNYLWAILPLLGVAVVSRRVSWWPVMVLLLGQLGAGFMAYLMTPSDVGWHLRTSVDRVVFQGALLGVLLMTVCLGSLLESSDAARTRA